MVTKEGDESIIVIVMVSSVFWRDFRLGVIFGHSDRTFGHSVRARRATASIGTGIRLTKGIPG
jgi:hypothetical protein